MTALAPRLSSLLLAAFMLAGFSASAQEDDELLRLQRAEADVSAELLQVENDTQRDRHQLKLLATELRTSKVTPVMLEDARLEQASLRSRESGLATRLKARSRVLAQLDEEIDSLERSIQDNPDDAPQLSLWRQNVLDLRQRRVVLEGLIEKIERLHQRYHIRTGLAGERMSLLQARFELPDLNAARQSLGRVGRELQLQVDELLAEASAARREASKQNDDPRGKARRRLLELQAMAAEELAEFNQLAIARLQVERVLQSLSALSGSRSTPVRVLKTASINVGEMAQELLRQREVLAQKRTQFLDRRQIVEQQGAIASGSDSTIRTRVELIDQLTVAADEQLAAIDELEARVRSSQEAFASAVATGAGAELIIRRELPADADSWNQLLSNLATLPLRVVLAFRDSLLNLWVSIAQSNPGPLVMCIALLAVLLAAGGWIRRSVPARFAAPDEDPVVGGTSTIWTPLVMLRRSLLSLLLALFVLGAGIILGIRQVDLTLLLAPLLIWPAVRIALDFVDNLLDEYTPNLDRSKTRMLLLETRWVVIFSAVLAAIMVAAHVVALNPSVIDALDRVSMAFLLLISVPLLHMRKLLLDGVQSDVESRWLRTTTVVLPMLLVLCALIGIAGYGNLAWDIAERLGWFVLVASGGLVIRDVLSGMLKSAAKWFERRDADSAPYWQQYILGPLYRLALLIVVLVAVQLLLYLYHWNAQTPLIGGAALLLDYNLFMIGETAVKLRTLGLAVLALFVAFWGASWSKQVSYRWLYTGVHDQGIRSSLSTFTQYIFVVVGLVVAMKIIGLDLTALTVFAGALGVGIGFGMQTIVVNFISGILLLVERPLATTDMVNVDKYEGEVTRIGIRSLTLKTFDNQEVIIPNSLVITRPFTNWTRSDDIVRTVLMIGISYDDDPQQAVDLIKEIVLAHPAVLTDPGTKVLLWEYGDSALLIRVQFHTRIRGEIGRADVRSQLLFSIWYALKSAGITIPYPQRDVHLRGTD